MKTQQHDIESIHKYNRSIIDSEVHFERGIPYIEGVDGARVYVPSSAPWPIIQYALTQAAIFQENNVRRMLYRTPPFSPPPRFLDSIMMNFLIAEEIKAMKKSPMYLSRKAFLEINPFISDTIPKLSIHVSFPDQSIRSVLFANGKTVTYTDYDMSNETKNNTIMPFRYALLWYIARQPPSYSLASYRLPMSRAIGENWQNILITSIDRSQTSKAITLSLNGKCPKMYPSGKGTIRGAATLLPSKSVCRGVYLGVVFVHHVETDRHAIFFRHCTTETGALLALLYFAKNFCCQ